MHRFGSVKQITPTWPHEFRWNAPDDVITARSHMLLRVDVDGQPYIVDAGFGGQTLTGPVQLELDIEQPTPHEPFRLRADPNGYLLQVKLGEQWKALYSFDLQPQYQIDYEGTNWYLSTHPASHFRTGLSVARADDGQRYGLRNTELAVHHSDGTTERRSLTTTSEVRAVLEDVFRDHPAGQPTTRIGAAAAACGSTGPQLLILDQLRRSAAKVDERDVAQWSCTSALPGAAAAGFCRRSWRVRPPLPHASVLTLATSRRYPA